MKIISVTHDGFTKYFIKKNLFERKFLGPAIITDEEFSWHFISYAFRYGMDTKEQAQELLQKIKSKDSKYIEQDVL